MQELLYFGIFLKSNKKNEVWLNLVYLLKFVFLFLICALIPIVMFIRYTYTSTMSWVLAMTSMGIIMASGY